MCGRFTLSSPEKMVETLFQLAETPVLAARYNIAPTQPVASVLVDRAKPASGDAAKRRVLRMMHWGLVPSWSRNSSGGKGGFRIINARSETAATKPSFRLALRHRRCLIVADGFYEWKKLKRGRQPYYIRLAGGGPFAFAGLWERGEGASGSRGKQILFSSMSVQPETDSCAILTTEPNELMGPIHDRMPVILAPDDYSTWLNPELTDATAVQSLLRPYPAGNMVAYPVSTRVNRVSNDVPECIERSE